MITKEYLQQELAKRIDGYKRGVATTTDNIIAEMKSILVLVDSLQDRVKDYDEALKRAKDFKNGIVQFALEPGESIVHYIFPELRESEDERIRKGLIKLLTVASEAYLVESAGIKKDSYLAYLEKQKEQKPADYPYLPGWRKNRDDNKPELKRSVLMLTTHGVAEGEWLGKKWCQYRWSCELKDDEILYWMHLSDLVRLEKEDEQKEQKEQNPAEDIKDQRQIYFMIEDGRRCGVIEGRKQVIDNPEKYGLQKPAEWSEEDEDKLYQVMGTLLADKTVALRDTPHCKALHEAYDEMLAWLKDLRPSWKPSEDQMDALKELIDDANRAGWVTPGATELYEQLKKL